MIETVLGPLAAERLGPTSMHEHLLSDASALGIPAGPNGPVDDVVLGDADLAAAELRRLANAWRRSSEDAPARPVEVGRHPRGATPVEVARDLVPTGAPVPLVVDPTVWGFGGPAARLPEIARASGVAIVAGVGAYVPRTRPGWLAEMDEDSLLETFTRALTDSLPGCDFRAGIVGVLSPGLPLPGPDGAHPTRGEDHERRLLRAGARAAAATGSAALVRLDPRHRSGPEVIETLTGAGLDPDRIVLSNIDGHARGPAVLRELAATGATLKWSFGYEAAPRAGLATATDAERADALVALLAEGHRRQVLACGIWTKAALHEYGGWGYDHLPRTVVPMLRDRGLTDADLHGLLVEEPRRLLDRP